ncbi:response regulator transcription factor [Roseateles violae]|uniref:Response regulator transcription factor n=1 Tax=Roseateles violae TaxID=3058042 RepID=A0ABT8DNT4_9BURK|nr:response regulator transcription factor [Pelomonas sp. PFR6]MDN3920036.1 response regulator transcription factor [Pelomonas sp. PFR6]
MHANPGQASLAFPPSSDEQRGASIDLGRKLLLVDDHELVRCGVRTLCAELQGVPLQWLEADSLQDALLVYAREEPVDAVLLDLNLADCKGLQGLRHFIEVFPSARIAVFSATQDEFVIRQARALGAIGYLSKGAMAAEMCEMLAALLWPPAKQLSRGHSVNHALFPHFSPSSMFDRAAELGPRHLEILEQVLSGCTNQEISNAMHLSLGTVKNYVSGLLLALDVKSRSHLISLFR